MTQTQLQLLPEIPEQGAVLSDCSRYRYYLWRRWRRTEEYSKGLLCFIMLNPSTADATVDDPTIRKCIKFAKAWGHSGIGVLNLFALRATDPKTLYNVGDPIGPGNDGAIVKWSYLNGPAVICAWGNHGALGGRSAKVLQLLRDNWCVPMGLRATKAGEPGHPLYLRDDTKPFVWDNQNK